MYFFVLYQSKSQWRPTFFYTKLYNALGVTNYFSGFYFFLPSLEYIYTKVLFLMFLMLTIYMINDQTHKTQNWNFEFSLCIEELLKNRSDSGYFHSHFEDGFGCAFSYIDEYIRRAENVYISLPLNAHRVL